MPQFFLSHKLCSTLDDDDDDDNDAGRQTYKLLGAGLSKCRQVVGTSYASQRRREILPCKIQTCRLLAVGLGKSTQV